MFDDFRYDLGVANSLFWNNGKRLCWTILTLLNLTFHVVCSVGTPQAYSFPTWLQR